MHLRNRSHTEDHICQDQKPQTDLQDCLHLIRQHMYQVQDQRIYKPDTGYRRRTEKQQMQIIQIALELESGLAVIPPFSVKHLLQDHAGDNDHQKGYHCASQEQKEDPVLQFRKEDTIGHPDHPVHRADRQIQKTGVDKSFSPHSIGNNTCAPACKRINNKNPE